MAHRAASSHVNLQGLVSKARGPHGIAQEARLRKTTGPDGKLYVLEDPRDHGKYHVLNDREVEEELIKSQLDAAAIAKRPPRASSPNVQHKAQSKSWQATIDEKAGVQNKSREYLDSSRENYRAASKSPPTSPMYRKVVSQLGRSILSESQEKSSSSSSAGPRPVSAIALARGRPASAGAPSSSRRAEAKEGNQQGGEDDDVENAGANNRLRSSSERRSLSAGRSRLLDNEAYILRKQWEEERRMLVEKEKAEYLKQQQDRTLRASKYGKEFAAMMKRAQRAEEKKEQRAIEKKETQEKAEEERRAERDAKRRAHLSKQLSKDGSMSWKEMQEQEETRRREREEKREVREAAVIKLKEEREAALAKEKLQQQTFQFKAEDPEKVADKLQRMQKAWEAKLEADKEKAKDRERNATMPRKESKAGGIAAMERRAEDAKRRAKQRADRIKAKEDQELEQKAKEEKQRIERLFNMKLPESGRRIKKAADDGALKHSQSHVVKERQYAEMKNRKQDLIDKKKEQEKQERIRETAATLKRIVQERERERKEKLGTFTELSTTNEQLNAKKAELAAAYKQRLQENKARLMRARSTAPSLMERHEHDMASKKAGALALTKIARAVKGSPSKSDTKYSLDDDDLFNDHEKLRLTSRSEG